MQSTIILAMTTLIVLAGYGSPSRAEGDAREGEKIFKKCAMCHSLQPGKVKIGPPLYGVLGRKAGSVKQFRYSRAMKSADIVWTPDTLNRYLADPKKFIPGNRMPFPGLKSSEDRANIIAFLKNRGTEN